MQPARDGVGRAAERRQVVRLEQRKPFVGRQPLAGDGFIEQLCNASSPSSTPAGARPSSTARS